MNFETTASPATLKITTSNPTKSIPMFNEETKMTSTIKRLNHDVSNLKTATFQEESDLPRLFEDVSVVSKPNIPVSQFRSFTKPQFKMYDFELKTSIHGTTTASLPLSPKPLIDLAISTVKSPTATKFDLFEFKAMNPHIIRTETS